ncbi:MULTISPECIES: TetR/AcrR family transcriptional regulator [unclassified Mycobacterium]|uniref:TetR/AcrR family transcriptional regulator n=1 Tax=unclassified Mycobacterium TaxID=2642494 RepID=UPI0029C62345|nr:MULTISPECIES: TetR/AcrR family transcriptional regulator [unclassified Mycobacterium]
MNAAVTRLGDATGTRERLLSAATALFIECSFAGTSHQMIADELGITKAAVHYYFRTREELLIAVMEPILLQIRAALEAAERQRSIRSRATLMLTGFAEVVARNRSLAAVLTFDPSVISALQSHSDWRPVIEREMAVLAAVDDGPAGVIKANAALTGLTGAASGAPDDLDDVALSSLLVDIGRRILGLRLQRQRDPLDR